MALSEGLSKITARRVASVIGVQPGLVTHYFAAIDELISAAFRQLATTEREKIGNRAQTEATSIGQIQVAIASYTTAERDPMGLLWLDAWRQAADRPLLRQAVIEQMELDVSDMEHTITAGAASGEFRLKESPSVVATRILSLLDGQTVASAIRSALTDSALDYPAVEVLLMATAERELGLPEGTLSG